MYTKNLGIKADVHTSIYVNGEMCQNESSTYEIIELARNYWYDGLC